MKTNATLPNTGNNEKNLSRSVFGFCIAVCLWFSPNQVQANNNAELLCMWKYNTAYLLRPGVTDEPAFTESSCYYFFSDHTYVVASLDVPYDKVLQMKASGACTWMDIKNNLVLFNDKGKQQMAFACRADKPASTLFTGQKEITQTILLDPAREALTYEYAYTGK
jgi:hypothetical protein